METQTQAAPAYYVWSVPGKPVVVHLNLEVVDRLLAEIMRGFGALPKRNAEVGGILIGAIEPGEPAIVRIEDFQPVNCGYGRGPSYLLMDTEMKAFEEACAHWQQDDSRESYTVGYYRSHTRDGLALAQEDIALLDRFFPSGQHIALLVKPYGTRASRAGFFFREEGVFQQATPLEFPFRRFELAGQEPPPRRPMTERQPRERPREDSVLVPAVVAEGFEEETPPEEPPPEEPRLQAGSAYAVTTRARKRLRGGWVWIPLSFIFLLIGILLGFQAGLTMNSKTGAAAAEAFSLGLSVQKTDESLTVRWDRQAPVIRAALRGVLEIEDGGQVRPVPLDPSNLQNGSIIVQNPSSSLRFRLTVYPKARVSVTETLEWKQ